VSGFSGSCGWSGLAVRSRPSIADLHRIEDERLHVLNDPKCTSIGYPTCSNMSTPRRPFTSKYTFTSPALQYGPQTPTFTRMFLSCLPPCSTTAQPRPFLTWVTSSRTRAPTTRTRQNGKPTWLPDPGLLRPTAPQASGALPRGPATKLVRRGAIPRQPFGEEARTIGSQDRRRRTKPRWVTRLGSRSYK
jgi:hypothetical protein